MNTPKKRWYQTMMEIITGAGRVRKAAGRPSASTVEQLILVAEKLPPADPALSDRELALAKDDNPTLRAIMHHAYAGMENYLAKAFDPEKKPESRLAALDTANGFKLFIEDIEGTRAALQKLIKDREARAAKEKK